LGMENSSGKSHEPVNLAERAPAHNPEPPQLAHVEGPERSRPERTAVRRSGAAESDPANMILGHFAGHPKPSRLTLPAPLFKPTR
jgi:hypothetical protein